SLADHPAPEFKSKSDAKKRPRSLSLGDHPPPERKSTSPSLGDLLAGLRSEAKERIVGQWNKLFPAKKLQLTGAALTLSHGAVLDSRGMRPFASPPTSTPR